MKSNVIAGLVSGVLLIPGLALAGDFNGIEIGYVDVETEDGNSTAHGEGYRIGGSKELGEKFFVRGDYVNQKYASTVDGSSVQVGVGFHHSFDMNDRFEFVSTISYVDFVEPSGVGQEDNGFELGNGFRARLTLPLELGASVNLKFNKDGVDTGVGLLGRWHIDEKVAVSLKADLGTNIDVLTVGIRMGF